MKDQITVYVDIEDSEKLQRVSGFIPASDYKMIVNINPYEYGMVEQENLISKAQPLARRLSLAGALLAD